MENLENRGAPLHHHEGADTGEKELRIFLVGFMGCGKTYWGQKLAQKLELPFFDLDHQIEEGEERSITQIFEEEGEEHFRRLEKEALHLITECHCAFIRATCGGTAYFYNNIEYMKKQGLVIYINCTASELHQRLLQEKEQRPLLKKLSDDQLMAYINKKVADRNIFYKQANVTISGEGLSLEKLISKIVHI